MTRRFLPFSILLLVCLVALPTAVTLDQSSTPQPSITIAGTVVDGDLEPVVGARVTLERQLQVLRGVTTDADGKYSIPNVAPGSYLVRAAKAGSLPITRSVQVKAGAERMVLPLVLPSPASAREETLSLAGVAAQPAAPVAPPPAAFPIMGSAPTAQVRMADRIRGGHGGRGGGYIIYGPERHDRYADIEPNRFHLTTEQPRSTFGADVDTAAYSNIRRFLAEGQLPPRDAVRIEDMLNYFHPDYPNPRGRAPIAIHTEVADAPWNPERQLLLVGVKARDVAPRDYSGRNIVLLVDVSGSMAPDDRLPLLRTAFGMFVDTLQPEDRLAIVTYAGTSGVHLPSTPVRERATIQRAIARLQAGGSTNGAQGIITAYRVAREQFMPGGINRVMLATDGDFNVGVTRQDDLTRLIERERDSGVFLSIFGVGRGNLNDASLEAIANKGNGHYVYLDSLQEARRILLRETDAMLETVAKDVKFQVEFNPRTVRAWKLIGYENRVMPNRDFDDDRKDGGELGAGHTVTVLYEIEPARWTADREPADRVYANRANADRALATVDARFKAPEGEESDVITHTVNVDSPVRFLPFAAAVAEFGLLLRDEDRSTRRWDDLMRRVTAAQVSRSMELDKAGFVEMVETAKGLARLRR